MLYDIYSTAPPLTDHAMPEGDLVVWHRLDDDCPCQPVRELTFDGVDIVVHNRLALFLLPDGSPA